MRQRTKQVPTKVSTTKGEVHIEKSQLINLGEYENIRITVGITLPISFSDDDLREAEKSAKVISESVDKLLNEKISMYV